MNIRELRLGQPLFTWYPISGSNFVSNSYPVNLDMDEKKGETCFYSLDFMS